MRQIKKTKKTGILRKLFVKISRILGFELIDQADLSFVSSNKQNPSKLGKKSITLPLGEVKIKRKINSLDVVLKTCTSVNLVSQNKKRIFEYDKPEYTFRSLNSIIKSLKKASNLAQNIKFRISIIDSGSSDSDLEKMKTILKKSNLEFEIIILDINKYLRRIKVINRGNSQIENNMKSTMASIIKSFELTKTNFDDLIYFVEDDYIHTEDSIIEMIFSYEKFATIFENDSLGASSGILRNSNNRQTTLGLLSKLNYDFSSDLKAQVGLDYRYARIYHVKTIRDLLGGDYYMTSDSEFDVDNGQGGLGDPIDYNFTNYKFDPSVIRGLEYYTGPIFEVNLNFEVKNSKGKPIQFGSIGGGGRYDNLVSNFGNFDCPATGISVGLDRLVFALMQKKDFKIKTTRPIVICVFDKNKNKEYVQILNKLRTSNISSEIYPGEGKLKKQMEYANKIGSPAVILYGDDEIKSGKATLKNLKSGKESSVKIEDLANEIKKVL